MKASRIFCSATFVAACIYNTATMAYTPEMNEQVCKKPKFREFSLSQYKAPSFEEISPESEFTFTLSVWANPETIKLVAKKQPLPFTVETTSTYHRVKAKLPASFNGQFVRIEATVKAVLGCDEQEGWLVKVADNAGNKVTTEEPAKPVDKTANPEAEKPVDKASEKPADKAADTEAEKK